MNSDIADLPRCSLTLFLVRVLPGPSAKTQQTGGHPRPPRSLWALEAPWPRPCLRAGCCSTFWRCWEQRNCRDLGLLAAPLTLPACHRRRPCHDLQALQMAVTLASYTAQLAGQPLCRTRALRSSVRPQAALPRRRAASVRAAAEPEQPTGLAAQLERMMSKYDFLSAGMGAMVSRHHPAGPPCAVARPLSTPRWPPLASNLNPLALSPNPPPCAHTTRPLAGGDRLLRGARAGRGHGALDHGRRHRR